jgi:beta-lactamase superfamily II metal-dependent hydrolase
MYYIEHGSSNFTIIDCCMAEDVRSEIIDEVTAAARRKEITRFISTHPDNDHILGLRDLDSALGILNFYCVKNAATKPDKTDDFDKYCALRDDTKKAFYIEKGCKRKWMNQDGDGRGSSGINILWPDVSNDHYETALEDAKQGKSPNNISCIIKYSVQDGVSMVWMGDLETPFMEKIEDNIDLPDIDILFAPHHGRDTGKVPTSWMKAMSPKIVVLGECPSDQLNYYAGYNTITQNSAGEITFNCSGSTVDIYVSNSGYSVSFLRNAGKSNTYGKYIGTLDV